MANKQNEEPQLFLPVEVKNPNLLQTTFKKTFTSFRYTALFQVLFNPFLWCNVGLWVTTYLYLRYKTAAGESALGLFPQGMFLTLSSNYQILMAMAGVLAATFLFSLVISAFGKNSLVTYINIALLILFVYVVKVMVTPLLLLQQ